LEQLHVLVTKLLDNYVLGSHQLIYQILSWPHPCTAEWPCLHLTKALRVQALSVTQQTSPSWRRCADS
jgi:hypothetical protein